MKNKVNNELLASSCAYLMSPRISSIKNELDDKPSFAEILASLAEVCKENCSRCNKNCSKRFKSNYGETQKDTKRKQNA